MPISWPSLIIAVFYLFSVLALFVYGVNFFHLSFLTWKNAQWKRPFPPLQHWPKVTVQLPIYNELYVAERIIAAAAALDYPRELLEIQVLDDSTDETAVIAQNAVQKVLASGIDIKHLHRTDRDGYKAGALMAGLEVASGDFIAIFDADFVPPADFLKRTLPALQDPKVAFVQTRWGHLNSRFSTITHLQSISIDAHFMVEQFARNFAGYWFNFNGTAGIWRKDALFDAGGWQADTLTEDLDISYRAYLRGWRGDYLRDVEVPAELPVSFSAFRRQQHRWARGSLECAIKLLPRIWRASISRRLKLQALLHLSGYAVHFFLFMLTLFYPFVLNLNHQLMDFTLLYGFIYGLSITAIAPSLLFILGQQQLGKRWWQCLPQIFFITMAGSGLMLNTVRAFLQIILRRPEGFERTAKFGIGAWQQDWTKQRYQLRLDNIVWFELALGLFSLRTVWLAIRVGNWGIGFYALLFGLGLLYVSGATIQQAIAVYWNREARAQTAVIEQQRIIPAEKIL